jgi:hypothetical protein
MNFKPGDVIKVKVGGVEYETVIDDRGVQRFRRNELFCHLHDSGKVDLNKLAIDYHNGKFGKREYAEFNMGLGYSVCGFADLSSFQDWEIENPVWGE